jgi:hypothetical protein
MTDRANRELVFTIHALNETGADKDVPAKVFVKKVRQVLQALQSADKAAGGPTHDYVVSKLSTGSSAVVGILERPAANKVPRESSVSAFFNCADAIYRSDYEGARRFNGLVHKIERLVSDAGTQFSHIDFVATGNPTLRGDEFLRQQAERTVEALKVVEGKKPLTEFRGQAHEAFDGEVKEVDLRGATKRAKLVLTSVRKEIDCVFISFSTDEIRAVLDQRVWAEGTAIYDGTSALPKRLEIVSARRIEGSGDLSKWRGTLSPGEDLDWESPFDNNAH